VALGRKTVEVKEKRRFVDLQFANYFRSLELAKVAIEKELDEKKQSVELARDELRTVRDDMMRSVSRESGNAQVAVQNRKVELSNVRSKLLSRIHKLQTRRLEPDMHWKNKALRAEHEMRLRHEHNIAEAHNDMYMWRKSQDEFRHDLDIQLATARTRKDHAKFVFLDRSSMEDDLAVIQSLEQRLELLSQELSQNTRALSMFRSKIQTQEDLYNSRFGAMRSVGLIGGDSRRGRSSLSLTGLPHFLPKLGA
jgi:hypothetical protein